MTAQHQCPQCGAELPGDAPDGVCPTCLVQVGFKSRDVAGKPLDPTAVHSGFVALSPAELARQFPQFEIVELLGKGGMGAVYKARQLTLDRFVALKILPPEVGKDPAFTERFMREARALAMLNHPSIVAVYDFGEADGQYYFVMEYVEGTNLRQAIEDGGLLPPEALAIVPQICDALQFAHDEGVVHRDIKPENILINKRGRVKIADFGLAKLLGVDGDESAPRKPFTLTEAHQVMGTPRYMSPEQMQGSGEIDHRADIYSLGVVFYEMLTGEVPIGRFEPPSKKAQIDVRLDEVVLRSLESTPARRYQHASEVKSEVESIVGSDDTVAPLPKQPPADTKLFQAGVRRRLKVPAIGLLVSGVLNLLAMPTFILLRVMFDASIDPEGSVEATGLTLIAAFVSLVVGTILLVGAARMLDLQSYPIAMLASVVALVPVTVGFPISLFCGIWALIVLSRRDVTTAFPDVHAKSHVESKPTQMATMIPLTVPIGLVVGIGLGAAVDPSNIGTYMVMGMIVGLLFGLIIDMNNRGNSKD